MMQKSQTKHPYASHTRSTRRNNLTNRKQNKKTLKNLKIEIGFRFIGNPHIHHTQPLMHTVTERFNANGTHSTVTGKTSVKCTYSLFQFLFLRWKFDAFRFRSIPPGHHIHNANFICKVMRSTSNVWVDIFFSCSLSMPFIRLGETKYISIGEIEFLSLWIEFVSSVFFLWFIQSGRHS